LRCSERFRPQAKAQENKAAKKKKSGKHSRAEGEQQNRSLKKGAGWLGEGKAALELEGAVELEYGNYESCVKVKDGASAKRTRNAALLFLGCAFWGLAAHSQDLNSAAMYQQKQMGSGPAVPACYLGVPGQMPGPGSPNAQMPGAAMPQPGSAYPQAGSYAQQGYYPQQGAYTQQGFPAQPGSYGQGGYYSGGSPYSGENSYAQQSGSYSPQGAYPFGPAQQQMPYPAGQSGTGQAGNLPAISAEQIIALLEQSPETLTALKSFAGQEFGVDPLTISDNGIYNCIQQDPRFLSMAEKVLAQRGYALNPQQGTQGPFQPQNPWQSYNQPNQTYPSNPPSAVPPFQEAEQPSDFRTLTPVPYPDLPSLRDLYSQDVAASGYLRRFGSEAFEFDSGNQDLLPMDLPVGPDYVLGPGDDLILNMWGSASARLNEPVDRQGQIALPEAGTVAVLGLTIAQAQSAIQKVLSTQYRDEHVELSLGRVRTVRIYVVGDVQRPGAYDVSSLSTPLNALYAAGGPTSRGSLRTLEQYRGKQLVQRIDLYDFLLHGVRASIDRLHSGDTILVPPVGAQVSVAGMVRRPAIYELKESTDLKDILDIAGGVLASADLKEIRVERVVAHERHTMLRVQIASGSDGHAKVPAFAVQDGDLIEVSPILPYNDQVVYLEGHVFKPGQYAWHEGMTVNDLVHSYQEVMPEPAVHAEVVRLVPPDLHPETIAFDLPDVLVGSDPVTLQPFDTVRIYGRYDFDAPLVSIRGPVLRPGDYPMSKGMTVAELVRMAGGFRRSAYREVADLSSYTIQNGEKVLLKHSTVALGNALDGDKSADAELQPGDVVGIRELSGWDDIGAAITIHGEINYAGTYGLGTGERLSSVLKRAGGFRADAYPEGAILLRVQVRELEEINRQEMILRVESSAPSVQQAMTGASQDELNQLKAMQQQQEEILAALKNHPSSGRLVIKISADIDKWENTPADIELRPGDELQIPKRPEFVLVSGQVYDSTGITYRPGKDAGWYLRQAGGVTRSGDRRQLFILRADGSVVGDQRGTVFSSGILSVRMRPGDSIIVPEKVMGGSQLWRNVLGTAQIMSSVAITGAVAGAF
jgi:protein involved in polysaccharide export with SLBB domain